MNDTEQRINVCTWVGDSKGCRHPSMYGKSYCESHHDRMYITLFAEMADYIIEQEIRKEDAHRTLVKSNR